MNFGLTVLCLTCASALKLSVRVKEEKVLDDSVPLLEMGDAANFFDSMAKRPTSIDMAKREPLSPDCPKPQKLLIIVYGLMRTYKKNWPVLTKQLNLEGLEKCHSQVDLLVNTDLKTRCSERDYMRGSCANEEMRRQKFLSNEEYLKEIKETYKPYLKAVFNTPTYNLGRLEETLDVLSNSTDEKPSESYPILLQQLLEQAGQADHYLNQYTHILAIRADSKLSRDKCRGCDKLDLQINLNEVCDKAPGFNVIHGLKTPVSCGIHSRDNDFGFLACNPKLMRDYFVPHSTCLPKDVRARKNMPPVPSDFGHSWDRACGDELMSQCRKIKEFHERSIRLGTLDKENIFVRGR